MPTTPTALARGAAGSCPACGRAPLFAGYLRVRPICPVCTAPLGRFRADDAPPYFTILVVGHVVVPSMFMADRAGMSVWTEAAIFLPLTFILSLVLLRPIKGATLGLMLRLGMVKPDGE